MTREYEGRGGGGELESAHTPVPGTGAGDR